jgi:hypothetical protein
VTSLRVRGIFEDRGHHEYDPTDVCVCMSNQALAGVLLEFEGAWCDFTRSFGCGGRTGTHLIGKLAAFFCSSLS